MIDAFEPQLKNETHPYPQRIDFYLVFYKRYIANDFQFHLLAPLLLIPFIFNRRRLTYFLLFVILLVNIITTTSIISTHPGIENGMSGDGTILFDFFEKVYITPWCRIGPFIIGMITKLILEEHHFTFSTIKVIIYTIISFLLAVVCIFFPFYFDYFPKFTHIIYQSLSHQCWSIAIAWLIVACYTNHGGLVNKILSWPIWAVIGRLSYSAYLIHVIIILAEVYNRLSTIHYQTSVILNAFISQTFLTLLASIFVVIIVETPFNLMEKHIRNYHKEKKQTLISHQNYGTMN